MARQNQLFDIGQQSVLRVLRSARSKLGREHSVDAGGERQSRRPSSGRSSLGCYRAARSRSSLDRNSENAAPVLGGNTEKPQQNALGGALGDVTNRTLGSMGAVENQTKVDNKMKPALGAPRMPILPMDNQTTTLLGAPAALQPTETERLQLSLRSSAQTPADYAQLEPAAHLVLVRNPQQVCEYVPDILRVLQRVEMVDAPSPRYIDFQAHVNEKMRGILVDWLVSVQQKYKLKDETVFLAVSLIDRYLAVKATARARLQLVGVTALLVAAKFEDMNPPSVKEMVAVTDNAYTAQDIINMEVTMLGALDFKICRPTPMQFFERYQVANGCSEAHRDLALYFLELALVDYDMLRYSPSHLAAAAVLLSNKLLQRYPLLKTRTISCWPAALAEDTHFTERMLKECAMQMCKLLENAEHSTLQAVRKKFSHTKYHAVAKLAFTG